MESYWFANDSVSSSDSKLKFLQWYFYAVFQLSQSTGNELLEHNMTLNSWTLDSNDCPGPAVVLSERLHLYGTVL